MAILVKKIGGRKYAYLAYRHGKKVVHKYLGTASNPEVMQKMQEMAKEKEIPDKFSTLFWDTAPSRIDLKKNSRYVIERVLEIGGLNAVQWIQRIYPTRLIIEVCESSRKVSERSKNFWRIWLGY
ncbi:MAG TPA: hypothetical protein DD725_11355 [Deltaproteobacteria bacterium]|nr:MAG: hypothetical protein A2Z89_03540 [Deltaproteobacteria bacterium GWA2_43_19]OGQ10794.1 MAG: hypothetical protein A3D30_08235 [Deltaproteobacteria bacterium RIFCSPHIGHO2_02_FULL_43_33]OGQ33783.1 MAG: hypothetical protein A3A85_00600 [Deltaproteobacteria bacterium RIFCSPLOWO2_01_FULL_42_9]HBR18179.1 hypothetical protein [Deltaproteobacteria bacterium]